MAESSPAPAHHDGKNKKNKREWEPVAFSCCSWNVTGPKTEPWGIPLYNPPLLQVLETFPELLNCCSLKEMTSVKSVKSTIASNKNQDIADEPKFCSWICLHNNDNNNNKKKTLRWHLRTSCNSGRCPFKNKKKWTKLSSGGMNAHWNVMDCCTK